MSFGEGREGEGREKGGGREGEGREKGGRREGEGTWSLFYVICVCHSMSFGEGTWPFSIVTP